MKKVLLLVGTFLLIVPLATAAPLCTTGQNVLSLGTCDFGGLTFSNWSVTPVGGLIPTDIYLSPLSNVTGNVVNMVFQLFHPLPVTQSGDVLFSYMVTGLTVGADLTLGTSSGSVGITENVCADDPTIGGCSLELAAISVIRGVNSYAEQMYAPTSQVWISKDIQMGAGATLSDFTNSHHIPEPVTYMLMGSGLLALGLLRRRVRKG